jgi:hypothetical protein
LIAVRKMRLRWEISMGARQYMSAQYTLVLKVLQCDFEERETAEIMKWSMIGRILWMSDHAQIWWM